MTRSGHIENPIGIQILLGASLWRVAACKPGYLKLEIANGYRIGDAFVEGARVEINGVTWRITRRCQRHINLAP